jgi:Chaperonin 10 Kd subunit
MKFRPLHDRGVVKRIDAEEKSAGGIIIPDTAKEKPSEGEIIAVGPGGRDENGKLIPYRSVAKKLLLCELLHRQMGSAELTVATTEAHSAPPRSGAANWARRSMSFAPRTPGESVTFCLRQQQCRHLKLSACGNP